MGSQGWEYAANAVTFMGTSPRQIGPRLTDRLTDANASTSPPVQAVDSDSLPFRHNALQALLAFSSLNEQIRQRRSRNQGRSGAASPYRSENGFDTEQFVLNEVLQLVAERALAITGADGVAIALAEGDAIICRASAGVVAPDASTRLDPSEAKQKASQRHSQGGSLSRAINWSASRRGRTSAHSASRTRTSGISGRVL